MYFELIQNSKFIFIFVYTKKINMPTLIFRTSGRKVKRPQPTATEKIIQKMQQLNYSAKEIKNRLKLIEARSQVLTNQ
jgi:hypothetical protein